MIPPQLQRSEFRFCKVRHQGKTPFEPKWQEHGYSHNDPRLRLHLMRGGNYGVMGGHGRLYIVDFDNEAAYHTVKDYFPETFTVRSAGKGLPHVYFLHTENDPESWKILDQEGSTLMDIQGRGKQVVGPSSKLENGREYTIAVDAPIAVMPQEQLKAILSQFFPGITAKDHRPTKAGTPQSFRSRDPDVQAIKQHLKVTDILRECGINTRNSPTMCPLGHPSKSKKCFSFTDDLWHCFHCEKGGNAIGLYMAVHGCDFASAMHDLRARFGIVNNTADKLINALWGQQ